MKTFMKLYNEVFPLKQMTSKEIKRKGKPWISKGIVKSSMYKRKLYKHFLKKASHSNEMKYKKYRNKLNHIIRLAKKNYCNNNRFSDSQSILKQTWQTMNELLRRSRSKPKLHTSFLHNENDDKHSKRFLKITVDEVKKEIAKLNHMKSCGIDGINPKVIKQMGNYISKPLCHIFNLTFSTGVIPKELKMSLVTPVFKADYKKKFTNYRPIAVLTCFSKLLEKLMYKRIMEYIEKKNILYDNQYVFRKKRSATTLAIL